MSTAPLTAAETPCVREERTTDGLQAVSGVVVAVLLGVVGLFAISSTCNALWTMWMNDPLKSIGGLIPIASLVLILRVWRSLRWEMAGTWWGLGILAVTIAVVHVRDQAVIEMVLSPSWSIILPPYSLVAVTYTAGLVLLFGGMRLLRAAWFPVALMWFVNPVPHFFNRFIDLPLQHASAVIARSFAHAVGQPLTPDQLSLMFTPKFGMFIAPGCNGIRGAVTMGFIALIAGYLYRLRLRRWLLLTAGAVLLGYVFNFVRLWGLVVYYVIALRYPWLQDHAAMGDYILLRWSPRKDLKLPSLPVPTIVSGKRSRSLSLTTRCVALVVLLALGSVSYARAMMRSKSGISAENRQTGVFPVRVGEYRLQREWNETVATGVVVFHWAEYTRVGDGPVVSIGVSPNLGAHDTLICHVARGEDWMWHGPLTLPTATGETSLSASLFNNGAAQFLEAASVCTASTCNQSSTERTHFGLIYSRPSTHNLLTQDPERPIPILLRAEVPDAALGQAQARAELTQSLTNFLSGANLADFTKPYRQH
jgi:exosortase J